MDETSGNSRKPLAPSLRHCANGPFTVIYQPQWVRLRVFAHDGNGSTSPGDNQLNYYVLYAKELAVGDLNDIPMSPFH
jgi:hypothetical protein